MTKRMELVKVKHAKHEKRLTMQAGKGLTADTESVLHVIKLKI